MPKKGEFIKFEYHERKIKSSFITFADFERILVPEIQWKAISRRILYKQISKTYGL